MGTVGVGFSMSLDGFIAGPNDDMQHIFGWMFKGDTDVKLSRGDEDIDLKVSSESAEHMEEIPLAIGAIVSGRRTFDVAGAWGGKHPLNVPIFVVTHNIPQEWNKEGTPFTFVTDGVESAIEQAKKVAGDKTVGVAGANVTQQCLKAGLIDEIGIDLVPVLLGEGIPLFKQLGIEPIQLETTSVRTAPHVTHLSFRVVK